MAILEVEHLKKTYTTRFGGTKVEALKDVEFSVEKGRIDVSVRYGGKMLVMKFVRK